MITLPLLITINIIQIGAIIDCLRKCSYVVRWSGFKEHAWLLIMSWISFSILIGLFIAINKFESAVESSQALLGGGQSCMTFMLPGLILFYLLLKGLMKMNSAK